MRIHSKLTGTRGFVSAYNELTFWADLAYTFPEGI